MKHTNEQLKLLSEAMREFGGVIVLPVSLAVELKEYERANAGAAADDTTAEWVDMKEALSCHCSKCGCIVRHDLTPERCPKCGRTMRSREQNPERSCLTCKHNENGINRPCSDCKDGIYDKWEEEPKWYEEL